MKTVVVTGATSGIGLAILKKLVKRNYQVIGIGRNQNKINQIIEDLKEISPSSKVIFFKADLSELKEVEQVAIKINEYIDKNNESKIYGLINNVGCVKSWYQTNSSGYELQFSLNHLTSYLLTSILLPKIINSKGKIIFTSSNSHKMMKINWHDIMYEKKYRPLMAYKQSKLCNMLLAYSLNELYISKGVHAYGVDPGLVKTDIGLKNTAGIVNYVWKIRMNQGVSPDIPASTYLYLLEQESPPQGLYYKADKSIKYNKQINKENADKLLDLSEKLTHIKLGGNL